jgi:hypothetical protein
MVFLIAAAALMIALLTGTLIEPPPAHQHGQRFDPCALEMDWGMLESDCANMQRPTSHARRIRWGNQVTSIAWLPLWGQGNPIFQTRSGCFRRC